MPEMEKKNAKAKYNFLIITPNFSYFTGYSDFEDAWNEQVEAYNNLYKKNIQKLCELLDAMQDGVNDLLKEKGGYANAKNELNKWTTLLPVIGTYFEALARFTSEYNELESNDKKDFYKEHSSVSNASKDTTEDKYKEYTDTCNNTGEKIKQFKTGKKNNSKSSDTRQAIQEIQKKVQEEFKNALASLQKLNNDFGKFETNVEKMQLKELEILKSELEGLRELLPAAKSYLENVERVDFKLNKLKLIPEGKTNSETKTSAELEDLKKEAEKLAANSNYASGSEKLIELLSEIEKTSKKRISEEKVRLGVQEAQADFFQTLMDYKGGPEAIKQLELQFPDKQLASVLAGFDVKVEKKEKGESVKKLLLLNDEVKPEGIKSLCKAFSGSGSDSKEGAKGIGDLINRGVTAKQLKTILSEYKEQLKELVGDGFHSDSELLANVLLTGLDGKPEQLKKLSNVFVDKKDLGTLLDGLASKEGSNLPRPDKKSAGTRMKDLLQGHFNGDVRKLKDPFFKNLKDNERLMREATTFKCKKFDGQTEKTVDKKTVRIAHFMTRHTREHFDMMDIKDSNTQFPLGTSEEAITKMLQEALKDTKVQEWLGLPKEEAEKSCNVKTITLTTAKIKIGVQYNKVMQFFPIGNNSGISEFKAKDMEKIAKGLGKESKIVLNEN